MEQEIIKRWKELGITSVDFNFSCGGDSMNETEIVINTKEGTITDTEIEDFIDDNIYRKVEFYVNSDGHYQGESGVVNITLNEDDDEPFLLYSKNSESEWNESIRSEVAVKLTEKEVDFIKKNVLNFNGSEGDKTRTVFKVDLFLSTEDEKFLEELEDKIYEVVCNFEPEFEEGELNEWFTFNTHENNLTINENNELIVEVFNEVVVFKED